MRTILFILIAFLAGKVSCGCKCCKNCKTEPSERRKEKSSNKKKVKNSSTIDD